LVQLSGLEEIFECSGPFTLFVPHNDAFDDIWGHFWLALLQPQNRNDLKEFLLYHILPGSLLQGELKLLAGATSLFLGNNITISRNPLMINSAQVVASDLMACNGVLHIIDKVLELEQLMPAPAEPPSSHSPASKTVRPSLVPSIKAESLEPTTVPIQTSSITPTVIPSINPSGIPLSAVPNKALTSSPTYRPSNIPTLRPSKDPTLQPSAVPTVQSEPPTILPSVNPSYSPSVLPSVGTVQININRRIYFAYVSEAKEEPTVSQYNEARRITLEYYDQYIRNILLATRPLIEFLGWNMTLVDARFNAGIPLQRFNIYMEFAMAVAFYSKESRNVPSPGEFLNFLKDGYVIEYLLNITSLTGTPFEQVTEGVFSTI
jgi:Fasciclin domain